MGSHDECSGTLRLRQGRELELQPNRPEVLSPAQSRVCSATLLVGLLKNPFVPLLEPRFGALRSPVLWCFGGT
jgi:hypothetical protein